MRIPTALVRAVGIGSRPSHAQLEPCNAEPMGPIEDWLNTVAADENYVYLGVGPRLLVVDASGLDAPRIVGESPPLDATIHGLARRASYVYATDQRGLRIIDLSNPARPVSIGEVEGLAGRAIGLSDSAAYILDYARLEFIRRAVHDVAR